MRPLIFILFLLLTAGSFSCKKVHCYHCEDPSQTDPIFDACANDTSAARRNAYSTLSGGGTLTNSLGNKYDCRSFDK